MSIDPSGWTDSKETINAFYDGAAMAIRCYAVWKDGEQWVGMARPLSSCLQVDENARQEWLAAAPPISCEWTYDVADGFYRTTCGKEWHKMGGTWRPGELEQDNFAYCPACGKRIKEHVKLRCQRCGETESQCFCDEGFSKG